MEPPPEDPSAFARGLEGEYERPSSFEIVRLTLDRGGTCLHREQCGGFAGQSSGIRRGRWTRLDAEAVELHWTEQDDDQEVASSRDRERRAADWRERIRLVWRDGRCAEVRFGGGAPYRRL